MFGREYIVNALFAWAKQAGADAVRGALKEVLTQSAADCLFFLSCFPPDVLEEALRRARERKGGADAPQG